MAQHVRADAFDVLWRDVAAAIQKGVGACAEGEIDRRTRRSPVTHESLESQIVRRGLARRPDDIDNVIFYAVIYIDAVDDIARSDDLLWIDHRIHSQIGRGSGHQIENTPFLSFLRIADA